MGSTWPGRRRGDLGGIRDRCLEGRVPAVTGRDSRAQPRRSSSSRKPASQEHWKEPARLVQWCSQPPRPDAHSSTSAGKPGAAGPVPGGLGVRPPPAPPTGLRSGACVTEDDCATAVPPPPASGGQRTPARGGGGRARSRRGCAARERDAAGRGWGRQAGQPNPGPPWGVPPVPPRAPSGPRLTLAAAAVGAEPVAGVAATLVPAGAVAADLLTARRVRTVVHVCGAHTGPLAPPARTPARGHTHPRTSPALRARAHTHGTRAPAPGPPRRLWGPDWGPRGG